MLSLGLFGFDFLTLFLMHRGKCLILAILNLRLFISIWLHHHPGTENYRSDISLSVVLKWFHNMWIQSPLIDFTLTLNLKGSTTQFGTVLGLGS